VQSGTFTSSSPFEVRLPSFGKRAKSRVHPGIAAACAAKSHLRPDRSLWTRMSHFLGDNMLIWASAGAIVPTRE